MKKVICILLTLIMALSVCACTGTKQSDGEQSGAPESTVVTESNTSTNVSAITSSNELKTEESSALSEASPESLTADLSLQDFFETSKYMQLQTVASSFVSAYIHADRDAALNCVKDEAILREYFPTEPKCIYLYILTHVSFDKEDPETAKVVISVSDEPDSGSYEFFLTLEYGDDADLWYKTWKVTEYDLNT